LQSNGSRKTTVTIDWISATAHRAVVDLNYTAHPTLHDWENWIEVNGVNGYTIGAKHESGAKAYVNMDRPDMGKHIIYSGKTMQRIKEMYDTSSIDILNHHIESGHSITRLDIALDFYGAGLTVQDFQDAFMNHHVITRLRSATLVQSLTGSGHTLYIGSRKKRKKLVRVYDKAAEMGWDFNCVRVEVQLMGKPATQAGKKIVSGKSTSDTMLAVMKNVVNFPTINQWNMAVEGKYDVQIGTQYDGVGNTRKWLEETVLPCIAREAVLDANWWIQYEMDLTRLMEAMEEKIDEP